MSREHALLKEENGKVIANIIEISISEISSKSKKSDMNHFFIREWTDLITDDKIELRKEIEKVDLNTNICQIL